MSEYVKKNELLHDLQNEHAMWKKSMEKDDGLKFAWGNAHAYERMINRVERGAFDAPDGEVQRLRAALDWVKRRFEEEWTYELGTGEVVEEIIVKFEEALSATEPTNKYFGAEWPKAEGDGNDA
jgi:hypothetical protein